MADNEKSSSLAATAKGTAPSTYKEYSSFPPIFQAPDQQTEEEMRLGLLYDEGNQGEVYNPDYLYGGENYHKALSDVVSYVWRDYAEDGLSVLSDVVVKVTNALVKWVNLPEPSDKAEAGSRRDRGLRWPTLKSIDPVQAAELVFRQEVIRMVCVKETVDKATSEGVLAMYDFDEGIYRVIGAGDELGDLVVLTSDDETDTNPQAAAVSANGTGHFVLAWYSTQDGGDIRLQAVGSDGQLYSGGSDYTVPASVKAVSQEDGLVISSDFRLAKRAPGSTIDGLTLVWAETAPNGEGQADHSVLYGAQLCQAGGSLYLSTPQALITLPDRTLANSFSAWRDGSGKVSAYIFGTYYDPTKTETVPVSDGNDSTKGYKVAADTDKLLTGGGTMQAQAISVDSIVVDYANLQTNSFTPVVFTLRNTGTTVLDAATVAIAGTYSATAPSLHPGDSASVTCCIKPALRLPIPHIPSPPAVRSWPAARSTWITTTSASPP